MPLISPSGKRKVLAPVRPNLGVELEYQRRLDALIEAMNRSVTFFIKAQYRENSPVLASDASPAADLEAEMRGLGARWRQRFDEAAPDLARHFARAAAQRSDASLQGILRRAGMTVRFRMTAAAQDAMTATVAAQVGLIKSIPEQYLTQVQSSVMRSVQTGRDLGSLAKELEQHYGVTRRRAAFISRSQNNIATATVTRVRQQELGITKAVWLHSSGGREPRPEHVAFGQGKFGGPVYEVAKGAFLDGRWTWPGVEPNCRCVSRAVLEALE
jgi:uncharacterized protein with gpF-like domain